MILYVNITIFLSLVTTFLNTANDLLYRSISKEHTKRKLLFYGISAAFSTLFAFIFSILFYNGVNISFINILFGLLTGVLSFTAYYCFLLSLSEGDTSSTVTIFRLSIIPSVALSILFLNDCITVKKIIAVGLCISSIILFYEKASGTFFKSSHTFLSLAACLSAGGLNFFNKVAVENGADSISVLFWRFMTVVLIFGGMLVKSGTGFDGINIKIVRNSGFSGFVLMTAILFMMLALKVGNVSIVVPITQLSFVLVAVVCKLFLKEKIMLRKWIGIAVAITAIILLN